MQLGNERFDVGGCFYSARYRTAPVAGVYHIHFQVYANPSTGSYISSMTGNAITEYLVIFICCTLKW